MTAAQQQKRRRTPPSAAEQHADWLALLAPDGPFLTLPVLTEILPAGLEALPQPLRERTRQAWAEFDADPATLGAPWVDFVLGELLRYTPSVLRDTALADAGLAGPLRPDQVVFGPDPGGGRASRLHVYRRPTGTRLAELTALAEDAARVGRDSAVPLALVTDGRFWLLVHAVRGGPTSTATFDADLWPEEPILLRAFATLLGATRVLPPPKRADGTAAESLAALFARTADAQSQITTTLGNQVRQAVELFVAELARLDRESAGALLAGVADRELYRGSLTTLLRLVFLLYAEQRDLLPAGDPVYADGYAVTTLYRQLTEARDRYGDEVGDRRSAAWLRVLATFGAVHGGCEHPDLRIPAHGGSLFDPARYPWLARAAVTDRVVHEILDALLVLKDRRGKGAERLSYTGLDVEQIGHVYEGLLEYSCLRVAEPYLGLIGKNEPELALARVEQQDDLAGWLADTCDLTAKRVEKALAAAPGPVEAAALHAACDNDGALADRVRPYWGLLRTDLRGLPAVFPAGSVLFTRVGDRRTTGTHYTPRALAEEVVEHTLAPLCYVRAEPGVHRRRTADELLRLKVCDPTMGSGAFLVAACRFLAERVGQAWQLDGLPDGVSGTAEDVRLAAMRLVAARCIYGVDRDDMAVELAKLSLWLVTLAKGKPFGFVDHALRCGDSLIGVRTERQIERLHLDPDGIGWTATGRLDGHIDEHIGPVLAEAAELRRRIEDHPADDIEDIRAKAALLRRAEEQTARLRLVADGVVGAALSTAGEAESRYRDRLNGISTEAGDYLQRRAGSPVEARLRSLVEGWLGRNRSMPIRPFHWPLEFPEVMRGGGFDAVVGNPPFIGGKRVSGALGVDVREYLKQRVANDKPGNADLCSYFLLRDLDIVEGGRVGIIATNTIAQGDTREVGLDQAVEHGWQVYRAVKSQPWPGTASLEVSLLWVGQTQEGEVFHLDGHPVPGISASLDPKSRVTGNPHRLVANAGKSFQGCIVLGQGFVLETTRARELIDRRPRNKDVLFPYLNGEDLNSRPDCSASRWVIDFNDWPLERARSYPEVFAIVDRLVRPERQRTKPDGSFVLRRPLPDRWWQYADKRPALRNTVANLNRVLAIALVSKTGLPVWAPTGQVFSHALGIFATDRNAHLTLLSSNMHFVWWTTKGQSTLRTDTRYTPSDGFETFPQPELTARMDRVGKELHEFRRSVMLDRQLGLTKLYNLVHDQAHRSGDVKRLRQIHTEVDYAVAEAYGWADLELGHGFHDTRQGRRFTIEPAVQTEILDRLLELNFARYEDEVRRGLHRKAGKRQATTRSANTVPSIAGERAATDGTLF